MFQSEREKCLVISITPYFGYEIDFKGTFDECKKFAKENNRGDLEFLQLSEQDVDLFTIIVSEKMIEEINLQIKNKEN